MAAYRVKICSLLIALIFIYPGNALGSEAKRKRYVDIQPREHAFAETAITVGTLYVISATGYYLTNREEVRQNATLKNAIENISQVTNFDNDRITANWGVHIYFGNLLYQTFRARSYSKTDAFLLTALQSALFEFTIEVVQEPVSLEDVINTPILGCILGRGLELASLPLLNSDFWMWRGLGHILNPPTIFGFYERSVSVAPMVGAVNGALFQVRF